MKKYQIVESYGNFKHAGSKATNDCSEILSSNGFEKVELVRVNDSSSLLSKFSRQFSYWKQWHDIYKKIEDNSILVLQHPFRKNQLGRVETLKRLQKDKGIKIISLVHDVELIRNIFTDSFYKKEMDEMISFANKIIVHNDSMKQWFIDYGVHESKLVILQIFDYLNNERIDKEIQFSKRIQIAGNLSQEKSPYIYKLRKLTKLSFDLFGINYIENNQSDNILYHGAFSPEDVTAQLKTGFGLVWDGDDISTCSGDTGEYLRYNNPHKLSLYLSSGLPVIVWSQSAEAHFVTKNQLGITVESLEDLPSVFESMSEADYLELLRNVKLIMSKLKEGYFLTTAISKAINE